MLAGVVVMGFFGVIAFLLGGVVYGVIDFAIAGALFFLGYKKTEAGDYGIAKIVTLICAVIIALLGLLLLGSAGAAGGLGLLFALLAFGAAAALFYSAMLISPGKRLF